MEGLMTPLDFDDSTFEHDFIRWNQLYSESIDANTNFHNSSESIAATTENSLSANASSAFKCCKFQTLNQAL